MANTILTPDIIAREALMVLRNNAVMANLVHRDYSGEFIAGVGDTITIRKPATFAANEFTDAIEIQDATESGVEVKMDTHLDVSFKVTSREMTMDIEDFSAQFLVPAMQAFNDKVDRILIDKLAAGANVKAPATAGALAPADIIAARQMLNSKAAPLINRRLVVDTTNEAALLNDELFVSAEKVGDAGMTLREASLGRKFGFDIYVDQNADAAASALTAKSLALAFHRNAIALVTRPLAMPLGSSNASAVSYDGFGLRVVYGYDQTHKTDTVSIDMLLGAAILDKNLAVALK